MKIKFNPGLDFQAQKSKGAFNNAASKILGRSVLQNPNGVPGFLLYGGWGDGDYRPSCWPRYTEEIHDWRAAETRLGLWWDPASSLEGPSKRS